MEKITLIIAHGPNDLEIPCRVMRSIEDAHDFCEKIGLERSEKNELRYNLPDLDSEANRELTKTLFTGYYGGCGEAYALTLREVGFDEVMVGWDLD